MAGIFESAKATGVDAASTVSGPAANTVSDSRCGECEEVMATWECEECGEIYCEDCRALVHSKGRRGRHTQFVQIRVCRECEAAAAKVECAECDAIFCGACCASVHAPGAPRSGHKFIKQLGGVGGKTVDLALHNGYGVPVHDLRLSRFGAAGHLETTEVFANEIASWCKEERKNFHDPDQATLGLPSEEKVSYLSLSSRLTPEFTQRLREHEEEIAERNRRRVDELAPVLSSIQTWKRLPRLVPYPTLFDEGNGLLADRPFGSHAFRHAVQTLPKFEEGIFKDSWYLLALSLVATNRTTFSNLFATAEFRSIGMYSFQFYKLPNLLGEGAGWRCVTVDDLVPCRPACTGVKLASENTPATTTVATTTTTTPGGSSFGLAGGTGNAAEWMPVFGMTDQRSATWSALLEKAYAKFLGSYTLLHRGDAADAVRHLTGGDVSVEHWDPASPHGDTIGVLWWRLKYGSKLGLLQAVVRSPDAENPALGTAGFSARDPGRYLEWDEGEAVVMTAELTPQQLHDMGVKLENIHEGANIVCLRNTLGGQEWTGDWGPTSPLWKKSAREFVNYKTMDEYLYWLPVKSLARRYNTILLCTNFAGGPLAHYTSIGRVDHPRLHARQFLFTIHDSDDDDHSVSVVVAQPDKDGYTHSQNYTDGADRPVELELHLFRMQCKELVPPTEVSRNDGGDCDEYEDEERWNSGESKPKQVRYEWPTDDEVDLQKVMTETDFVTRRSATLTRGTYVLTVNQGEIDHTCPVTMFVSFHDDADPDGPYSCPFACPEPSSAASLRSKAGAAGAKARKAVKPKSAASLNNTRLATVSLGSWADPEVAVRAPRPKTPRELVMQKIQKAKS
ncbi:Calpain-type cysteine protease ADL1 [Diplonema papillatum]|nr:Calpain-type cysteine protease ADL1 [Diplonema papillatum]